MIQFLDSNSRIEFFEEEAPPLELDRPRVFQQPRIPRFCRGDAPLPRLVARAQRDLERADTSAFGQVYGELLAEFQPAIQWALSCWEFLLSTEGCRFLPRSVHEKLYCRGDYRVFTEADFHRSVHKAFKECLLNYFQLQRPQSETLSFYLKRNFWPTILKTYQTLEQPPDPRERRLTGYSYLRCIPYQFLNSYHHDRVWSVVEQLPVSERQLVELYYLRFYKEEAVLVTLQISQHAFQRRRAKALRAVASADPLARALLTQIERY